jgi:glycine/D-amino acid oxidase-like deaminating enzyme
MTHPVAIIGAGLTGCCVALELARRNHDVTLIEQDALPMNRASLRNEGKIHLGLIYANDNTLETARLQLGAALRFSSLLERWIGDRLKLIGVSTPFDYLVAQDSLLEPSALASFYAQVDKIYQTELASDASLNYLGYRPDRLAYRLDPTQMDDVFSQSLIKGAFRTQERAIDTEDLATQIRHVISDNKKITFLPEHEVSGIERTGRSFTIKGVVRNVPFCLDAAQVVNASWERRLAIDQTLGIRPRPNVLHRLKYRVICQTPEALKNAPSMTIVIGRYGDIVIRPNGTSYLSWYPACLQGWTPEVAPPRSWDAACRGETDPDVAASVRDATIRALARWVPAIASAEVLKVDAGAIVADGRTDVDDASSELHHRATSGVFTQDGYHSVDPGKFTAAPLFAYEVAERVDLGRVGRTIL